MGKILGTNSTLEISTDGGTVYTEFNCATSIDYSVTVNEVDSTCNDSGGYTENLSGDQSAEISVEGLYDSGAGQRAFKSASQAGTLAYFRYRPEVAVGELQSIFQGRVFDYADSSAHDEAMTISCTVKSSGAIVESNQT
jgi:predicted secreted protein